MPLLALRYPLAHPSETRYAVGTRDTQRTTLKFQRWRKLTAPLHNTVKLVGLISAITQLQWKRQRQLNISRKSSPQISLRPLPNLRATPAQLSPLKFSRAANWVAPGHVLVGRYPLTDPDVAEGRTAIRKLVVDACVSTFVCFQSEVPPQDELGKWPREGIKLHGRKCLRYAQLARQFAGGRTLHFMHKPLDDLSAPGLDWLVGLVSNLEERVRNGEVLYLHCWGGRGRSAMVAACLLTRLYGLPAEEALQRVQLGYDSRDYDNCVSPETERQRQLVREFAL